MLRVAMLLPVVVVIALVLARLGAQPTGRRAPLVPWFLLAFAGLVAVNSMGVLPMFATTAMTDVSRWCLVAAIAALGMKTSFKDLAAAGWRPIGLIAAETAWIAMVVLIAVIWVV
jgi:uncharacterized membrane protein YadS